MAAASQNMSGGIQILQALSVKVQSENPPAIEGDDELADLMMRSESLVKRKVQILQPSRAKIQARMSENRPAIEGDNALADSMMRSDSFAGLFRRTQPFSDQIRDHVYRHRSTHVQHGTRRRGRCRLKRLQILRFPG